MNKTVILFASARRNGNTGQLADHTATTAQADFIDIRDYNISEYDYEHKNIDDDFIKVFKHLLNYQNIIFASPVYWDAVAPGMKIFLDRISDLLDLDDLLDTGRQLRGKNAYVLSTSIQKNISSNFIGAFEATFHYLGINYKGYLHVDCKEGYKPDLCKDQIHQFSKTLKQHLL